MFHFLLWLWYLMQGKYCLFIISLLSIAKLMTVAHHFSVHYTCTLKFIGHSNAVMGVAWESWTIYWHRTIVNIATKYMALSLIIDMLKFNPSPDLETDYDTYKMVIQERSNGSRKKHILFVRIRRWKAIRQTKIW